MEELIKLIHQEFDEVDKSLILPDKNLSDIIQLDSMGMLILIISIEDSFGVVLSDEEIKRSKTLREINTLILQKKTEN